MQSTPQTGKTLVREASQADLCARLSARTGHWLVSADGQICWLALYLHAADPRHFPGA